MDSSMRSTPTEPAVEQAPATNRRDFLKWSAGVAAVMSLPVLQPTADAENGRPDPAAPPATGKTFDAGPVADFATESATDTWAKTHKFLVVRHEGKVYAPSSVCTHRGCILNVVKGNGSDQDGPDIYCKCHRSHFDMDGVPTAGPAKRPLPRYAVSIDAEKHLIVDLATKFSEPQWGDPKSFVKPA